nr:unnamed protein product [Haemonchus contortus]
MAPDEKRENPFLRTIQSLEEKYGALEAQGLDSGMEIDFISGKVHVTNVASKRAVQTVYRNLKRLNQVFGLSKRSAPCNSLEVYGREFRKREKQCRQLDKEFETKFKSNYPEWKPCGPSTRNKIRSTVRETVKEFVFERPSDYINYIKRGTGSSFDIFHRKDIILPPMVLGDCSSTLATTSSKTIGRRCSGNDSFEPTSLPIVAPNGLWNESVAAIFKSYEDGFLAVRNKTNKMTILGFDAREFRKQCRDPSQTALSGFVNCAGEYRESPGENYLDNGMKEDRRAMAAAKSRNEVAYIARYRGDAHEGMSCDQIRQSFKVFMEARNIWLLYYSQQSVRAFCPIETCSSHQLFASLHNCALTVELCIGSEKVEKVIANVSTKIKSTADLQVALEQLKDAREFADVLEVTHLYASARKTKAAVARTRI